MNTETKWIVEKLNDMYIKYNNIRQTSEIRHSNGTTIELDELKLASICGSCETVEYLYNEIMKRFDMRFDEHCAECTEKLGKPFDEVHHWLDEFAKIEGWNHRCRRHHKEGVEEARKLFGDEAAKATELHIRSDCNGELPTQANWRDVEYWLNT